MADHNIDILIRARDQASKTIAGINKQLGGLGSTARQGVGTAARNLARLGAIGAGAAAGIGVLAIRAGVDSLATLETAVTSVDGAIRQMGETGQVTGQQVAGWANEIEANVGAAFDDKHITKATATLIRFGKVAPQNLRPAMVVMTDLAAKTGSVESASTLLAKALADPTKAAGRLARAGVILSKQDQARIDQLIKKGKVEEAQALIIDRVSRVTKGAAAASQGPYAKSMATLKDATEDAERALAVGFLPVIQRVADWLKTKLADPSTQQALRDFGTNLAGAFDTALNFAQKLPWDKITSGLKTAAGFAQTLIGAFTSMPPEVQGTIIALAGLNKLSGGAIGSIVSSLGSGLIKGVLGMTAGVVNINAGIVKGLPGGSPGGGGSGGPGGSGGSGGGSGEGGGGNATGGTAGASIFIPDMHQFNSDLADKLQASGTKFGAQAGAAFREQAQAITPWDEFLHALGLKDLPDKKPQTDPKLISKTDAVADKVDKLRPPLADMKRAQASAEASARSSSASQESAIRGVDSTTRSGTSGTTGAVNVSASRIVSAINGFRIPAPIVNVNVGPGSITKTVTNQNRYGSPNGSAGGHGGGGSIPT